MSQSASNPTSANQSLKASSRRTFLIELVGLSALLLGLLGYAAYQILVEDPTPISAQKPSPKAERPASKTAATIAPRSRSATSSPEQEIYQKAPATGIYYAANSLFNTSRREIASNNGRFCIKVVNGPTSPLSGFQKILVSSLTLDSAGAIVDATNETLKFDHTNSELIDSRDRWQRLEDKVDRSDSMEKCLETATSYANKSVGEFIESNEAASVEQP